MRNEAGEIPASWIGCKICNAITLSSISSFDISVDQIFFPAKAPDKTTQRRQLDELLNSVDETDLVIVTDTVKGIQKAKEAREAGE